MLVTALTVVQDRSGDPDELVVVSFNLCGNVCNEGGDASARYVAGLAEDTGTDVLLLQEACRSQARLVARRLGGSFHHVTTFGGDGDGANRCPEDDYGIAVVTTGRIRDRWTVPLPNPGLGRTQLDERAVACIEVDVAVACTTHLARAANDPAAHDQQVAALLRIGHDLAADHGRVLLGGDLNARAPAFAGLAPTYRLVTRGAVDHVFATRSFELVTFARRECECSDHRAQVVFFQH